MSLVSREKAVSVGKREGVSRGKAEGVNRGKGALVGKKWAGFDVRLYLAVPLSCVITYHKVKRG